MVDTVSPKVASKNSDAKSAKLDRMALDDAIRTQGRSFVNAISTGHEHLFADVAVLVTTSQIQQMKAVIEAVERVVGNREWLVGSGQWGQHAAMGVFYGYDFHLNADGAHLIEINSNAGGGFLNALLLESQRNANLPGRAAAVEDPQLTFLEMFRNEWRLERGETLLKNVVIVDEQPQTQYLYPEFLLAQDMFERAEIVAHIVDHTALQMREDGLYLGSEKIDLVYNRLTDFSLQQYPVLRQAHLSGQVVLTPNPQNYVQYANKRNLARLTDAPGLRTIGASDADIATLQSGVPHTIVVRPEMEETLWAERKQWFFKPSSGFGSKGAYRGANLTRRVFGEIMQGDYVAQKLAAPGENAVGVNDAESVMLKYDVRCYAYNGQVQLVAARLYQGQTTNFRTAGGGFAMVRVVE